MGFLTIFFIGSGLAMDAFAASVCRGMTMKRLKICPIAVTALFFGGFQTLMPLIGWCLGVHFEKYITSIDHWIAFCLLAFLGVKMISDIRSESEETGVAKRMSLKELIILSVATSIDALAVGVSFAFLDTDIVMASLVIGVITFVLSFAGVCIGLIIGGKCCKFAQIAGGAILILMGTKILFEHIW